MANDRAMTLPLRTVRVRTEVAALTRTFDYAVPARWAEDVRVGTRVRVPLHGRTVRGWVVQSDVGTLDGVEVLPLKSWLGWGPPDDLVEVAEWASWRWAGPVSFFLRAASPSVVVRHLPDVPPAPRPAVSDSRDGATPRLWDRALTQPAVTVVRLPPATDLIDLVLGVVEDPSVHARGGSVVVLVPSTGWAERLTSRLLRRGCPATGAWDSGAGGLARRRGQPRRRLGPRSEARCGRRARRARRVVPGGECADLQRRRCPLRAGPPSGRSVPPRLARAAGGAGGPRRDGDACATWCGGASRLVHARTGGPPGRGSPHRHVLRGVRPPGPCRARRPRHRGAGTVGVRLQPHGRRPRAGVPPLRRAARCTRSRAAASRPREEEVLRCLRCGDTRPVVCAACGRLRMKTLRAGVSRLREELAALLGVEVGEVAGPRAGRRGACLAGRPGARGHRGGAAPGAPRRGRRLLGHRSAPARHAPRGD